MVEGALSYLFSRYTLIFFCKDLSVCCFAYQAYMSICMLLPRVSIIFIVKKLTPLSGNKNY